jgi:hypothetical protein
MRTFLLLPIFLLTVAISAAASPRTPISLSPEQILEFDQTAWITLTREQQAKVSLMAGFCPSRVRPVYHAPDGEVAELGYNMALRTGDKTIEVYREYLLTDEQVKERLKNDKRMMGGIPRSAPVYPSYIVDGDGKYWKFLSRSEFSDDIKRTRKRVGLVYIHMPTSLVDTDTVASRDGLRRVKAILKEFDLPSYEITKK